MKNVLATIGLFSTLIAASLLFGGNIKSTEPLAPLPPLSTQAVVPTATALSQQITQVYIPDYLTFCDAAVPLREYDIKERLDKELTIVAHQHSRSIRIIKLANRWLPTIERILRNNGVPEDFKYLAVAESSLENVVSPKKAKGFWQFLSSTAKTYGLEVSDDVDERYHVEKATVAACKYFKKAYERFGDWSMVAGAYNMGIGGIGKQASNQHVSTYYDLYLNSETHRYLFRILAYKVLLEQPAMYGFHFSGGDLYPPLEHTTIVVQSIPNIATFAASYGTNYKKLKVLNPWLRKTSLRAKSGKSYSIKIPI